MAPTTSCSRTTLCPIDLHTRGTLHRAISLSLAVTHSRCSLVDLTCSRTIDVFEMTNYTHLFSLQSHRNFEAKVGYDWSPAGASRRPPTRGTHGLACVATESWSLHSVTFRTYCRSTSMPSLLARYRPIVVRVYMFVLGLLTNAHWCICRHFATQLLRTVAVVLHPEHELDFVEVSDNYVLIKQFHSALLVMNVRPLSLSSLSRESDSFASRLISTYASKLSAEARGGRELELFPELVRTKRYVLMPGRSQFLTREAGVATLWSFHAEKLLRYGTALVQCLRVHTPRDRDVRADSRTTSSRASTLRRQSTATTSPSQPSAARSRSGVCATARC